MKQWLAAANIERFRNLLRGNDLSPAQRETIERLMAEERAKLAALNGEGRG